MINVNKPRALQDFTLTDELLTASLIKKSIDFPTKDDISLSFLVLSSYGSKIAEIEACYRYNKVLQDFVELTPS